MTQARRVTSQLGKIMKDISSTALTAQFNALKEQRDNALDRIIFLAGRLAEAEEVIKALIKGSEKPEGDSHGTGDQLTGSRDQNRVPE